MRKIELILLQDRLFNDKIKLITIFKLIKGEYFMNKVVDIKTAIDKIKSGDKVASFV